MQGLGQRFIFDNRHLVVSGRFFYSFRNVTGTFGDHRGRHHRCRIKLQCHRQMDGVGNDDIGLRDRFHHPAGRHFQLNLSYPAFYLGITFALLAFVFNLLLGHLEVLLILPALIYIIEDRQNDECQANIKKDLKGQLADKNKNVADFLLHQTGKLCGFLTDNPVGNTADKH